MIEIFESVSNFFRGLPLGLYVLFLFVGVLPLIILPIYVIQLPTDHWVNRQDQNKHNLFIVLARNLVASIIILIGAIFLVTPGQGLLFIFSGVSLGVFPGKEKIIQKLIRVKNIQKALDRTRQSFQKPPFDWPASSSLNSKK